MSNQRPGKMKAMTMQDHEDKVSLFSLVQFCKHAEKELRESGDHAAALRFEVLTEYLTEDFKGGYLKYTHKALGL